MIFIALGLIVIIISAVCIILDKAIELFHLFGDEDDQ